MALTNKLTAIGDAIRSKTGGTDLLSLDGMVGAINGMGGGEAQAQLDGLINGTCTEVSTNVTGILTRAFYENKSIVNVNMPNVNTINDYAFSGCESLALTSLPSGLTNIGAGAFRSCENLALTSLPSGLTNIGGTAFQDCKKLKITEIPSGVVTVNYQAFSGCSNLDSVTFQGTPSSIGNNAFYNCTKLKTINVPWAEGEVAGAPWGATNATINYNYTGA